MCVVSLLCVRRRCCYQHVSRDAHPQGGDFTNFDGTGGKRSPSRALLALIVASHIRPLVPSHPCSIYGDRFADENFKVCFANAAGRISWQIAALVYLLHRHR